MTFHRLAIATLALSLCGAALPGAASAQSAAATLPNTFDAPSAATATAGPPAQAPDIARAEEALRAVIASVQGGAFDYSVFTDDLATQMRAQAGELTPIIQSFGALQSVAHVQQEHGVDLFRVTFANQQTEWLIAFAPDDRIAALRFRPAAD